MSTWTRLERPKDFKEKDLQWMFDKWVERGQKVNNFAVAGAPAWLLGMNSAGHRPRTIDGSAFTPDVEWQVGDERYVAELKCANKGEPLALAQVLYYSDLLNQEYEGVRVVPVVVSQYSLYLRRALHQLRSGGYDSIRYLEHDALASPDGWWFIWFDDPFANYESASPQGVLFEELGAAKKKLHWYSISGTSTWFAVEERRPDGERVRPHIGLKCRCLSVAMIQNPPTSRQPASDQEWLVWHGETTEGGSRPRWTRNDYFRWSPNGDKATAPTIFP